MTFSAGVEGPWWRKALLTEEDGALHCYFCGKLVHIPGMKAHMVCAINAFVEMIKREEARRT